MNYLGIDYGLNKIGLALADNEVKIAMPREVIFEENPGKQIAEILNVIKNEEIGTVVIGLPTSRSGKESAQTAKVRQFVADLRVKLPKNVTLAVEDERLSTKMSRKLLTDIKNAEDDSVAAACILQTWLDKSSAASR